MLCQIWEKKKEKKINNNRLLLLLLFFCLNSGVTPATLEIYSYIQNI